MMDLVIAAARLLQFVGAVSLFGAPLFFLYAWSEAARAGDSKLAWGRPLVGWSSGLLAIGTFGALLGQTAVMAGDPAMAINPEALKLVLTGTTFGYAIAARLALAVMVLAFSLWLSPGLRLWRVCSAAGALILASFAFTGHGAAEEGPAGVAHAVADILHLIAAGVWLGALAALGGALWRVRRSADPETLTILHQGLERFSGVGSLAVAALLVSGLVNSWFLVGLRPFGEILATPYGGLLMVKLVLFAAMLLLAAANRFRHTPRLGTALSEGGHASGAAVAALRRSVLIETALGIGVLTLVSLLGMLAPVSAQM